MRSDGTDALTALIDGHAEALFRYGYRLCGSRDDAEDLVQESFCKAHEHIGQLRDPARARHWLFRILRNAYLQSRRGGPAGHCLALDDVGELCDSAPADDWADLRGDLQAALDELAEEWRTPLILFYFEDFTYRDIAEQLDLPIGTVMSRLARAKAYLRRRLAPDSGTPVAAGSGKGGDRGL